MAISEQERDALREQFLAELKAEHERRLRAFESRKARMRQRQRERDTAYVDEAAALRDAVRQEFYREHGYQLYTDSSGRQVWLPPEEYAWRTRRRRRRIQRHRGESPYRIDRRTAAIYAAVVLCAVTFGVLLVR